MTTTRYYPALKMEAFEIGCDEIFDKPYTMKDLTARIEKILCRGKPDK